MASTERIMSGFSQFPHWHISAEKQKTEFSELKKALPPELSNFVDTAFFSEKANKELTKPNTKAHLNPGRSGEDSLRGKPPIPWFIAFLFQHPTLLNGNKLQGRIPASQALRNDHPFIFNTLLKGHSPQIARWINEKDYLGETPLHTAIAKQHTPEALRLIDLGADPFLKNNHGQTALDSLAEQGKVEQIKSVLNKVNAFKEWSSDPAIQKLEHTAQEMRIQIDRHKRDYEALSSANIEKELFNLCHSDWGTDTVPKIYGWSEAGFDFNKRMVSEVPLYWAIENKKPAMAKALLRSGADPSATWPLGTQVDLAIQKKQNDILKEMLHVGADIHRLNGFGRQAVFKAIQYENYESAQLLAQAGADVKEGLNYMKMWPDYGDYPKAIKALEPFEKQS